MCLDFLWFSHKFLILKATRPGTVAEFRRLRPFTLVLRWMPWALGPRPLRCWSAPENLAQQILRPDRLWHTNFGYLWIMKSVILCWVLHQYSWNLFFFRFLFSMVLLCSLSRNCKRLWLYITPHLNPYELPKVGQNVFPSSKRLDEVHTKIIFKRSINRPTNIMFNHVSIILPYEKSSNIKHIASFFPDVLFPCCSGGHQLCHQLLCQGRCMAGGAASTADRRLARCDQLPGSIGCLWDMEIHGLGYMN